MATIVAMCSHGGGVGKSHIVATIGVLMASRGLRIGVVDTDIRSPGMTLHLGLQIGEADLTLADYLLGTCDIDDAVYDVTHQVLGQNGTGALFAVPSTYTLDTILRVIAQGYDLGLLSLGFQRLIENLDLDLLILDTHTGVTDETMATFSMADVVVVVLRPELKDLRGNHLTMSMTRRFGVPRVVLAVNMAPPDVDHGVLAADAKREYGCDAAVIVPYCVDLTRGPPPGLFLLEHPEHEVTARYRELVDTLVATHHVREETLEL
jgi:MinD-like ATPase involved in chromosome partitioning or flagellar assembly